MPFIKVYFGSTSALDLHVAIDEVTRDDVDYIKSSIGPMGDVCRVGLYGTSRLDSSQPLGVGYTVSKSGSDRIDITVRFLQNTTTIATWVNTDVSTTATLVEQTLTAAQVAAVDWNTQTNFYLEFEANVV